MTPVTIQFNKIVFNDVKDKEVLLEPSYRKKTNVLANPMPLFGLSL